MKNNKDCKIVQDLLPNYIDKLTNEETNTFIEEHLNNCPSCKEIYENMKKELKLSNENAPKKEVQYIKKYSHKLKLLKVILLLIVLIFVLITSAKLVIITNLQAKANEYIEVVNNDNETYFSSANNNYHKTTYLYSENSYIKLDVYGLDDKTLLIYTTLQDDVYTVTKMYKDGDTVNMYKEDENGKTAYLNTDMQITISNTGIYFDNFAETLYAAITHLVIPTTCNGKDCYYITFGTESMYIDKETGLATRILSNDANNSTITDYFYDFDTVTEDIFEEPDINEYTIVK